MKLNFATPFDLFEIDVKYGIDRKYLKEKFLQLQKQYHPDNSSTHDVIISSNINSAYQSLIDDLSRALLVLKINHNIILDMTYLTNLPAEFLIMQFELHEDLELAEASQNIDKLEQIEAKVLSEINLITDNLYKLFDNNDVVEISKILPQLSYYHKLLHNINEKIQNI